MDFETLPPPNLNDVLSQFYVDIVANPGSHNIQSLVKVRNEIMKYIQGHPKWKSVPSSTFQTSNIVLENLLQSSKDLSWNKSRPVKKCPMEDEDLVLLMNSGLMSTDNPTALLRKVWFDLAIHLGCLGQDAQRNLTCNSFILETDESNHRYYRLNKNIMNVDRVRSKHEMQFWSWDARMYEMPENPNCPVKSLDLYISKRNKSKDAFFQRPKQTVQHYEHCWYEAPVGHCILASIMSKMSEEAGLSRMYTNTSVRLTAAKILEEQGYMVENIMGIHPRYKPLKGYQYQPMFKQAADLLHDSLLLHKIFYGDC